MSAEVLVSAVIATPVVSFLNADKSTVPSSSIVIAIALSCSTITGIEKDVALGKLSVPNEAALVNAGNETEVANAAVIDNLPVSFNAGMLIAAAAATETLTFAAPFNLVNSPGVVEETVAV